MIVTPIFDGHVHLIDEDADDYVAALLHTMDRHGVVRAVVFGLQGDPACGDHLALQAHARYPDRFLPFACEIDDNAPDLGEQVGAKLADPSWRGLGEVFLATKNRSTPYQLRRGEQAEYVYPVPPRGALDPGFREVFEASAQRRRPVLVHCDDAHVMDQILALHPETTFIWGHADHSVGDWNAERIRQSLQKYPNLYYEVGVCLRGADLTWENLPHLPDWYACWIPALEQFPGRLTFGSDPYDWRHVEPDAHADALYAGAREVEKHLSAEAARMWLGGALAQLVGEEWG